MTSSPTATSAAADQGEPARRSPFGGRFRLEAPGEHTRPEQLRTLLLLLGLPTFGLAFAITILTTYGPVVLLKVAHSPAKVGYLIGGEGAFALVVPLIAGAMSDRLPADGPRGRRMPFVLVGAPLTAGGLILLPFAPSYALAGLTVLVFFVGYYLYYPPYRAIYADLLPRRLFARAQSGQAIQRGAGLGVALLTGGVLLGAWHALPFVFGAAVLGACTLVLKPIIRLEPDCEPTTDTASQVASTGSVKDLLLRNRPLQLFAVANTLWEFSFAGLKTFIVLYVVKGLGRSPALASAFIAIVAVAYVIGAPIAGRLADRVGIARVMSVSALVYGLSLCLGVLPHTMAPMLVLLPIGALAGAVLMTLPQALAFTLAPNTGQGAAAGLVDFSRGVGVVLGPIAVGAAVSGAASVLSSTSGYAIMWPAIGVPVLLSLLVLRRF